MIHRLAHSFSVCKGVGIEVSAWRFIYFPLCLGGIECRTRSSDNDRKKFDKIITTITDGFISTGESIGGELPELAGKTLAAILSRLHERAEDGCDIKDL